MYRTINNLGDLRGKRILVRLDLNVPMRGGEVADDAKIVAAVPTVAELRRRGAACIVISHLGEGKPRETLAPVATRFAELLGGTRAGFCKDRVGTATLTKKIRAMRTGGVLVLENIRRYAGECDNSPAFATQLARLADVYVNDAFAACHRAHASLVAIAAMLPAAAGPLILRETAALDHLTGHPRKPFVALLGGAKITTKAPVMVRLLRLADAVLVGGALASQFFAARGYGVGASLLEEEGIAVARRLRRNPKQRTIMLPLDVVVANPQAREPRPRVVQILPKPHVICLEGEAILDVGPMTVRAYAAQLKSARTILWNGPMGMFEQPPFHHASVMLARVIASRASSRAYCVVGGGESLAVLTMTGMATYVDHASTGGGAMLAYIADDGKLPGLRPLTEKVRSKK